MQAKRRWQDLSERQRRWIVVGGTVEGVLKVLALRDLRRRPAAEVHGARWAWGTAIVLANSAGAVPVAYFLLGRRRNA